MPTTSSCLHKTLTLRLLYPTEAELSAHVGLKLGSNKFSKMKPFQREACFAEFDRTCRAFSLGRIGLASLIDSYEAASRFYIYNLRGKAMLRDFRFAEPLVIYYIAELLPDDSKLRDLCLAYHKSCGDDSVSLAILLLIARGILPVYDYKPIVDVENPAEDLREMMLMLRELADRLLDPADLPLFESKCLVDIERLAFGAKPDPDAFSRLMLIHFTSFALRFISNRHNPSANLREVRELKPFQGRFAKYWRSPSDPEGVVWKVEELNFDTGYLFTRYECQKPGEEDLRNGYDGRLLYDAAEVLIVRYGDDETEITMATMLRPGYIYSTVTGICPDEEMVATDYPAIKTGRGGDAERIEFLNESPLAGGPLTLEPVTGKEAVAYYDRKLASSKIRKVDMHPQYAVNCRNVQIALTRDLLIVAIGEEAIRIEKFDAEGIETIPGIDSLTIADNYLVVEAAGKKYLCLDSIEANIEWADLLSRPYVTIIPFPTTIFP